ncbi:MAG: hypothetical protein P1U58_11585, partial [Verrucomicrobiales bacterium]|nr:hypothetical protein [Verrucomicrobiales bacterium]
MNKRAQSLARAIKPNAPAKKFSENGLASLEKQMINALQILESSNRSNGPDPQNLISKAIHLRSDIGSAESVILTNTLLTTWRAASSMGLFDEEAKFRSVISKGRGVGEESVFELVIPGEIYPPASNQLANLRLIPLEKKRVEGSPLTDWERTKGGQLKKLVEERQELAEIAAFRKGPKVNQLGQTEKEQLELWKADMEKAGEAAHQKPKIRVQAKVTASPSHMSKDRWRVSCELGNVSSYPTEVKTDIWIIGYTEKHRTYFVMAHQTKSMKFRSGEVQNFDVYTRARSSYKDRADDIDGLG